jgi:predicted TIM-barrel fold metal-dependent hydrolase
VDIICFDSNVGIGKQGLKNPKEIWKTEDILSVMEQCGVSASLVYSRYSKDYAPKYGNEDLAKELEKSGRLFGCYTILPSLCGDFLNPEETMQDIKEKKMVAAKIFPRSHRYFPDERTMGEYYRALAQENIPLLADCSELNISQLECVLENHPDLNIVYQGVRWDEERMIFPLMREFKNLYLDFSVLQSNYVVERMVESFGADRFVFGSGMPAMSLGAARALIDYANISDSDKQKIFGGNLARLCHVPLPGPQTLKNDSIAKEALEGKPISVFLFDSHTHVLEDGGHCGGGLPMMKGDLEHMDALYKRIGVDKYCVAPWLAIWTDSEAGNKVMLDMVQRKPERVYGYVLIDPNYVQDIEGEAKKYHLDYKIPGLKMFYARTRVRYNDPVYDPWWKIANENSLFALTDNGSYPSFLNDVEELAIRYPNVTFFLDHAGQSFDVAINYAQYAKKYPNVYLQITYTSVTQGVIEYFVQEGLAGKVLYGTDSPMRDPRPQLGWVAYANISYEDKKKILGENMEGILKRCFKKN